MRVVFCAAGVIALTALTAALQRDVSPEATFEMGVVTTGLDAPWEVTWGPDDRLWVTERRGRRVVRVDPRDGSRATAVEIAEVHQSIQQDGLLGLALHPDLLADTGTPYVYLAWTYDDAPGPNLRRRMAVRRYAYDRGSSRLTDPVDILTGVPANDDHFGGRLAIGPDRRLYLSVGDQGANFGRNRCMPNQAQRLPSQAEVDNRGWSGYQGKILRMELDGSIPADNPAIGGVRSHVFSFGHRNPLGLAFGPGGRLYESEHGPSSDDEVNLIEGGRNYGWPLVAGHRDDRTYAYENWAASTPTPCGSLPPGNTAPPSVPTQAETAWTDPVFAPPLRTFFTVDNGEGTQRLGGATIAPGGIDVYTSDAIPGWSRSLLALSLIRGIVYRMPLAPDGRAVVEPPLEVFATANRYRDIAIAPDGRTIYLATDIEGASVDAAGARRPLANPGAILAFTYAEPTAN
jgi:PQQ-dependent dehydrogenase (s-GDH family)